MSLHTKYVFSSSNPKSCLLRDFSLLMAHSANAHSDCHRVRVKAGSWEHRVTGTQLPITVVLGVCISLEVGLKLSYTDGACGCQSKLKFVSFLSP